MATFDALKKSRAQAGDLVAVFGIGGLGHLALQYARKMGFRVVAIGRGAGVAQDSLALGAHIYIDTEREDAAARLRTMGAAQAIVSTIGKADVLSTLMNALAPQGCLVVLGAGKDSLSLSNRHLVTGERSVVRSFTGSPYENEKALDFSVLAGVRPRIETVPLEEAYEAYRRMKSGQVKFRTVLRMGVRQSDVDAQPEIR